MDNCNRAEGIGSRFLSVLKSSATVPDDTAQATAAVGAGAEVSVQPIDVRRGDETTVIAPSASGERLVPIGQSERVEVQLPRLESGAYTGHLVVNEERRALPLGSSLDGANGVFYWQPAAGFLGAYELEFVPAVGGVVRVRAVVGWV